MYLEYMAGGSLFQAHQRNAVKWVDAKICHAQVLSNFGPLEESLMARYTSCSETLGFYVILPCPCDVHTDRAGAASAAVRQQLLSGKDPQRSQRLPEARQHDFCECYILLIPGITWG